MDREEEKRLSDVETGLEVLESQFGDYKIMADERLERINETFSEVKTGQQRLVKWHIANLLTLIGLLSAAVIALLKFAR